MSPLEVIKVASRRKKVSELLSNIEAKDYGRSCFSVIPTVMDRVDKVFKQKLQKISPFEFNQQVADCFDDMVSRSVPFYHEIHSLLLDLVKKSFQRGRVIYDLGCSTGTTLHLLGKELGADTPMIGVDNSAPMLEHAKCKMAELGGQNVLLLNQDLAAMDLFDCGLVVMNYTLQFIEKEKRAHVLSRIYQALQPEGLFFYAEKIKSDDQEFEKLQTDLYYDFKRRNGYSELEISQKREALENRLTPLTASEHFNMLREAGFKKIDMPFRWYNFACFVGIK